MGLIISISSENLTLNFLLWLTVTMQVTAWLGMFLALAMMVIGVGFLATASETLLPETTGLVNVFVAAWPEILLLTIGVLLVAWVVRSAR